MDYEQMSVQELRAECQARDLGTARARADLIKRLTDHDTQTDGTAVETPAGATPAQAVPPPQPDPAPTGPNVYRKTFDAEPGGPDEETHLAYRQATIAAAVDAGHTPRGDARLADSRDGRWVYEVLVRQETPS